MDLSTEATTRLLREIIVAVDERSLGQDSLDSLVDVKGLVGMSVHVVQLDNQR